MANLTITIKSQPIRNFGPSPSTKWGGTFNWTASGVGPGNGTWGVKSAACLASQPILKNLFRTLTHTSHVVSTSDSVFKNANKNHIHTMNVAYANTDKELSHGMFSYIFSGPTTNAESQNVTTFTANSVNSTTYTTTTVSSTTWT